MAPLDTRGLSAEERADLALLLNSATEQEWRALAKALARDLLTVLAEVAATAGRN